METSLAVRDDYQLPIMEYNGQRVITAEEIDRVHKRPEGTAARNFRANRKRFILGMDFIEFKGEYGRKALCDANLTNFVKLNNSPNFNVRLFTEMGYLMLAKSLQDDIAWKVQRTLINNYFRAKESAVPAPANKWDMFHSLIDQLQKQEEQIAQQQLRIESVEKQIEGQQPDEDAVTLDTIAETMKWLSRTGKPHKLWAAEVARDCGINVSTKRLFDDELSQCIQRTVNGALTNVIYIKQAGLEKIIDWCNTHNDGHSCAHYERYQCRRDGHEIGEVNPKRTYYMIERKGSRRPPKKYFLEDF